MPSITNDTLKHILIIDDLPAKIGIVWLGQHGVCRRVSLTVVQMVEVRLFVRQGLNAILADERSAFMLSAMGDQATYVPDEDVVAENCAIFFTFVRQKEVDMLLAVDMFRHVQRRDLLVIVRVDDGAGVLVELFKFWKILYR